MSLEQQIAALVESNRALIAALERSAENQERALTKLEGTTTTKAAAASAPASASKEAEPARRGRGRPRKDEREPTPAAKGTEAVDTDADAAGDFRLLVRSIGKDATSLKAHISAWTAGTDDADERQERVDLLKSIADHLGIAPKFAELVPHAKEVLFYIERSKLGLSVDFAADYGFTDPSEGADAGSSSDEGDADDDFG
jgi:hypothetical protein